MKIKNNDFIEVEYTGWLKADNKVFDTTDKALALKEGILNPNMVYGPMVICVGQGNLVKGLDEFILDKEQGDYDIDLEPEKAFGKKDSKLMRLIPLSLFRKQGIKPQVGLQVNIDGIVGTIKTAGSRVIVDFNHPLSGREVRYKLKIIKIVTDETEKLKSLLLLMLGVKDADVKIEDNKAEIEFEKEIPENISVEFMKKAKELIPNLKDILFKKKKKEDTKK